MLFIAILVIVFGILGIGLSLYLRFTVKSPILTTEDGKIVTSQGLSIQEILNLTFTYFAVLHFIITLIGMHLLLSQG